MLNKKIPSPKNPQKPRMGGCGLVITIGAGLIMLLMAVPLLVFIEWTAADAYYNFNEIAKSVVAVHTDKVDEANEGKLVYMRGFATADETLRDPSFDVSANGLLLHRVIKMYQWVEHVRIEKKDKAEFRVYEYQTEWVDHWVNSKGFNQQAHKNPPKMPYSANKVMAKDVMLGAFKLPETMVARITPNNFLAIKRDVKLPPYLGDKAKAIDGYIYIGDDPQNPDIGDVRISFAVADAAPITVIAQQVEHSFKPYITHKGQAIELLANGNVSPEEILVPMKGNGVLLGFVLLIFAFIFLLIGVLLIFNPLLTSPDIPYLTSLTNSTRFIIICLITAAMLLVTCAVAWFPFWPQWAIGGLLLLSLVCLALVFSIIHIQKEFIEASTI